MDIEEINRNSEKAELLEMLANELERADQKVIVILVEDKDGGKYSSQVMTLGVDNSYEAYGMLETARQDLQNEGY